MVGSSTYSRKLDDDSKMIELTNLLGHKFEVNEEEISEILPNDTGSYAASAKAIVAMENGHTHAVLETVEQVERLRKPQ